MRIVLSTFGTAGDIIPFVRLSRALHGRGHKVTVHCWEHFRTWFPSEAEFVPAAGGVDAAEFDRTMDLALRQASPVAQKYHYARAFYGLGDGDARARAYYDRARDTFESHDLALINVLDHVGQAAAEHNGLPWVSYVSRPPPDPEEGDRVFGEVDAAVGELLTRVTGELRHVRLFRELSPLLTFAVCSPHIAPPHPSPTVRLTGAWLDTPTAEPLPPVVEDFLAAGPALLSTFGTMPDVNGRSEALKAAAEQSGWRAIIQVLPPAPAPSPVPGHILVVTERLPFASLFPRVTAVVHHGSVGTTHEIVRAGRPSLVIPHMGDQFFWAIMLHERGLGPPPVRFTDIDANVVGARMSTLREGTYERQAVTIGARVAAEDGVAVAVRNLEAVAASVLS